MLSRRDFLLRSAALAAVTAVAGACSGSDDPADDPAAGGNRDPEGDDMSTTTATDPLTVARDAFLAGVPLVTTVRTMQTFARLIGVNRLFVTAGLVDPTSHLVVAPNRDTVYALAVLDLRSGPQVLTLPDIPDRYHVVQLLDAWMGGFGLLGTRSTDGRAGSWAVVPPGYDGPIPEGTERLDCPTPQAFVLGRVRAIDEADAAAASTVARGIRLAPLDPAAAPGATGGGPSMPEPAGTPQSIGANGVGFFDELGDALPVNPPVTDEQRVAIEAAADLGVGPGERPGEAGGEHDDVLAEAVEVGLADLEGTEAVGVVNANGWAVNLDLGTDDTAGGLLERAVVARYFWGPVPAEEAVYPRAVAADDGEPLDGTKSYRIRFEEGQLPPVDGFWSFTAYGPDMFLVPNDAGRYSLSGDTPGLVTNADGSVDVLLQHDAPAGREANWLPVPEGPFNVIMRLYLPQAPIVEGTYDYPPITVLDAG